MKDYYKILEIHPEASLEVMNKAYRALVQKYHPDLFHLSDKALMQEKMKEINEAYEVLSHETTRKQYDRNYAAYKPAQSGEVKKPAIKNSVKNIVVWGLVTFVTVKFLIKPLLMNPSLRVLVLGILLVVIFRLVMMRRRTQ